MLPSLNPVILANKSTQFITGHVIYNPAYTYKFQLKTTYVFPKEAETFMKAELSLNSLICLGVKVVRIWKKESAY